MSSVKLFATSDDLSSVDTAALRLSHDSVRLKRGVLSSYRPAKIEFQSQKVVVTQDKQEAYSFNYTELRSCKYKPSSPECSLTFYHHQEYKLRVRADTPADAKRLCNNAAGLSQLRRYAPVAVRQVAETVVPLLLSRQWERAMDELDSSLAALVQELELTEAVADVLRPLILNSPSWNSHQPVLVYVHTLFQPPPMVASRLIQLGSACTGQVVTAALENRATDEMVTVLLGALDHETADLSVLLTTAIRNKASLATVRMLIAEGAILNSSALDAAAATPSDEGEAIVRLLIDGGAKSNMSVFKAVQSKQPLPVLEKLLTVHSASAQWNNSPLWQACIQGSATAIVEALMRKDANPLDQNNSDPEGRFTCLMAACAGGCEAPVLWQLLSKDTEVDRRNNMGKSALLYACEHSGTTEAVLRALLGASADASITDSEGNSLVAVACMNGVDVDVVRVLIASGISVLQTNRVGQDAVMAACSASPSLELLNELIAADDAWIARVNETDRNGMSALMLACKHGAGRDIIRALLDRAADATIKCRHQGKNALMYAVEQGCELAVAQMFIEAAPDSVNTLSKEARSALFYALSVEPINQELVSLLVAQGANVNLVDKAGLTPLLLLCSSKSVTVPLLDSLIAGGVDMQQTDTNGMSALMLACVALADDAVIRKLLEAGVASSLVTQHGWTALMFAAAMNHDDAVRAIVTHDISTIDQRTSRAWTFNNVRFKSNTAASGIAMTMGFAHIVPYVASANASMEPPPPERLLSDEDAQQTARTLLDSVRGRSDAAERLQRGFEQALRKYGEKKRRVDRDTLVTTLANVTVEWENQRLPLLHHVLSLAPPVDAVTYLLEEAHGDPNKLDRFGRSPLAMVCSTSACSVDVFAALVKGGADLHAGDPHGWTASMYAARFARADVLEFVKEHHSDALLFESTAERNDGMRFPAKSTPLSIARLCDLDDIERVIAGIIHEDGAELKQAAAAPLPAADAALEAGDEAFDSDDDSDTSDAASPLSPGHIDAIQVKHSESTRALFERLEAAVEASSVGDDLSELKSKAAELRATLDEAVVAVKDEPSLDEDTVAVLQQHSDTFAAHMTDLAAEHQAVEEQAYIRTAPALNAYYFFVQLSLNCTVSSARTVVGEFGSLASGNSKQRAGSWLDEAGKHVPMVGWLVSLLGKGIKRAGDFEQYKAIRRLAQLAASSHEAELFVEALARELTLGQETQLVRLGTKSNGAMGRVTELFRKARETLDKTPLASLPSNLRYKVEADTAAIVSAIVGDRVPVPCTLDALPQYTEVVLGDSQGERLFVSYCETQVHEANAALKHDAPQFAESVVLTYQGPAPPHDLNAQLARMQAKLEENQAQLELLSAESEDVSELQAQIAKMSRELGSVKKTVHKHLPDADGGHGLKLVASSRPEDVRRVQQVTLHIAELQPQVRAALQAAGANSDNLSNVDDRLSELERRVESSHSRSSSLGLQRRPTIGKNKMEIGILKSELEEARAARATQEDLLAAQAAQIAKQEKEMSEMRAMLQQLMSARDRDCTASGPCCNDTSQRVFDANVVCRPIDTGDACDYVEERCDFVNAACPADVRETEQACCGASFAPPTATIATNPAQPELGGGYRVVFTFAKTVAVQAVWELRVEDPGNSPLERLVLSSALGSTSGELDGGKVLTYELPSWSLSTANHQYCVVLSAGSVQDSCAGSNTNSQLTHTFTTAPERAITNRDAPGVDVFMFARTTLGDTQFVGFVKTDLERLFPGAEFTVEVLGSMTISCDDDNTRSRSGLQFRVRFVSNEAGGPAQSHADALIAMLRSRSSVIMRNSASYSLDTAFEDSSCGVSTLTSVVLEKCDNGDLKAACDDCDPVPDRTVYVALASVGALVLVTVLLKKCAPGVMGSVRNGLNAFATPRALISVAANGLDTAYDVLFLLEVAPSAMKTPGSLSFTLFFFVVLLAIATGYIFMWHVVGGWLFSSCSRSACVQAMPLYEKAQEEGWALHKRLTNPTNPRKSFSTWLILGDLVTIALTTVIGFNECLTETTFVSIVTSLVVVAIEVASLLSDSSKNALADAEQLSTRESMNRDRDLEDDGDDGASSASSGDIELEMRN